MINLCIHVDTCMLLNINMVPMRTYDLTRINIPLFLRSIPYTHVLYNGMDIMAAIFGIHGPSGCTYYQYYMYNGSPYYGQSPGAKEDTVLTSDLAPKVP